jgi:IclR family pca regulon transcriptional regulator
MAEDDEDRARSFVASMDRGLRVIRAFDERNALLSVSEVAERTGISRAAARRFLKTLQVLDYVGSSDGQRYFPKPSVLGLGFAYLSSLGLNDVIQPILTSVLEKIGEPCSLAVLNELDVVYVARAANHQPLTAAIRVGDRLPAFSTTLGRVMLAGKSDEELEAAIAKITFHKFTPATIPDRAALLKKIAEIRQKGYSFAVGEQMTGLAAIALPIRNPRGATVAALGVSSQFPAVAPKLEEIALPLLRDAAVNIELALRLRQSPLSV